MIRALLFLVAAFVGLVVTVALLVHGHLLLSSVVGVVTAFVCSYAEPDGTR